MTHDDGGPVVVPTMTLLDWFAGQALAGMTGDETRNGECSAYARDAYGFADAMIAEKRRREGGGA